MGSEGQQQELYYQPGLYYQAGTNYFGYDPSTGLSLTAGVPKWDEIQNIWSYDVQDLHHSALGLQQEYLYQPDYHLYPQSYDSYQHLYSNYSFPTDSQTFLSNQNHQHHRHLIIPSEIPGSAPHPVHGSTAHPVYQQLGSATHQVYGSAANQVHGSAANQVYGSVGNQVHGSVANQVYLGEGKKVQVKQSGNAKGGLVTGLNQVQNPSKPSSLSLLSKPSPLPSLSSPSLSLSSRSSPKPPLPKSLSLTPYSLSLPKPDPIVIRPSDFNRAEFRTEFECARFFVIKSYSEDDVHRSIKYGVWSSTPNGNRKLSVAYEEAQRVKGGKCPVFLFFSVNGSGHFCGVAEMCGPVDFSADVDLWQQDKWPGSFPVRWHILKDVPNTTLRQVALENNEFKPVTHSRDTQEVSLVPGTAILKIFKNSSARESVLDDFMKYEELERAHHKRRSKLLSSDAPVFVPISKHPNPNPNSEAEGNPKVGGGSGMVPEGNHNSKANPNLGGKEVASLVLEGNPNPSLGGWKEMVGGGSGLVSEGNPNGKANPKSSLGGKEVASLVPGGNPNSKANPKSDLGGGKEVVGMKKDLKKQESGTVVKANGDGNPNPNLGTSSTVVKANGNGNGNPNLGEKGSSNPNPKLALVKKEPVEKVVVGKKKDVKKQENGNPSPNLGEKEGVKQVNGNGTFFKVKNKPEPKENGKIELVRKDLNESKPLDPIGKTTEKIGSLSINSSDNKETGGSSSKKGQGDDVVTIGSMHVRVNNNNK